MPGRDGTGPMGQGAMTGGGFGPCGSGRGTGRGFFGCGSFGRGTGMGMGSGGRGFRHWFRATGLTRWMRFRDTGVDRMGDVDTEKELLKREAEALQAEMDLLKKRMAEIEAAAEKK